MKEKKSEMLAFRVTPSEKQRAKALIAEKQKKLHWLTETIGYRELFGFTKTEPEIFTEEERRSLRSDLESNENETQ